MDSARFYTDLPSFTEFGELIEDRHFRPVPDDWQVFITDVRGSTKAIEAGRYKDVNTIGAASIASVLRTVGEDLPYVFGGDGATLLIPPHAAGVVEQTLVSLAALSQTQFGLPLRVGRVPVADVVAAGHRIEVAKHELTAGRCVAMFRGGGLGYAEDEIKRNAAQRACDARLAGPIELAGLSCRWNQIPARRGRVLSVLVLCRQANDLPVYGRVLTHLQDVFAGRFNDANPVNADLATYRSARQCFANERRFHSRFSLGFLGRVLEIFGTSLVFRRQTHIGAVNTRHYQNAMRVHSDFRKFDDMLRMVIDCSPRQALLIRSYLQSGYDDGELYYGIHESDASLMTCYVEDVTDGAHIHFIDGSQGGYAMAAKQLKAQLRGDDG